MTESTHAGEQSQRELSELPPPVVDTWSIAVALIGVSLWAQCFWTPLVARMQAGAAEPWRILPLVAPLGAVGAALIWRAAWLRLFVVPASLVPGLLMIPAAEAGGSGGVALLRIGTTLGIYSVFAGLSLRRDRELEEWMELDADGETTAGTRELATGERPSGLYPYFVRTRLVWMVGLFVALIWGIFGSAATQQLLSEHFAEHTREATMFLAVLMTFVWCVGIYLGALRPIANVEYRLRKRKRSMKERPDGNAARRRLAWRAVLGCAGIAGVVLFAV